MIGQKIKVRREMVGINQSELADSINIGRSSISNIEKGRQLPPLSLMYHICNQLEIDVQSIMPTYSEIEEKLNELNNSFEFHFENEIKDKGYSDSTISIINDIFKSI
ncbi:MAG: helix-turn-helix transcriptional regulator [Bacteroidota bacterium]